MDILEQNYKEEINKQNSEQNSEQNAIVIGGGLAGCEAAWQLATRGIKVKLYEMRPIKNSPAHHTDKLAELVCSNSLRSNMLENAVGLLKEEMRMLNSLIMKCADACAVPAGGALAVDREDFSSMVTFMIEEHPLIELVREEFKELPQEGNIIVASGPLTSETLAEEISKLTESKHLYFYDAAAPIVTLDSLDMNKIFRASRYNKGDADYLNCPMEENEYETFWNELINAEVVPLNRFEEEKVFEGCMPVETMAKRGIQTLLFGPLKPVGLEVPKTGRDAHAIIQLRQDNKEGTLFNLVGFQTHLKWGEQKRVFSMIPGLENAEFVRYGVMHRNTFINSPELLSPTMQFKKRSNLLFAGQMTGVEGYIESASSGLISGINLSRIIEGKDPIVFPPETAHGALCHYITDNTNKKFQPMNVNFGIFPNLTNDEIKSLGEKFLGIVTPDGKRPKKLKKPEKYKLYAERALMKISETKVILNILD